MKGEKSWVAERKVKMEELGKEGTKEKIGGSHTEKDMERRTKDLKEGAKKEGEISKG